MLRISSSNTSPTSSRYVIGDISLADLIAHRHLLSVPDVFVVDTFSFFEHLD